jgi:hypothetical protein
MIGIGSSDRVDDPHERIPHDSADRHGCKRPRSLPPKDRRRKARARKPPHTAAADATDIAICVSVMVLDDAPNQPCRGCQR